MEVKGTSVLATKNFVADKFGQESLGKWIENLPEPSRQILGSTILSNNWYPFQEAFVIPTRKICDMFFQGSERGARELGRFSAERSLTGIYRAFAKVASVGFIVKRTANIFKTYYLPGNMEVVSKTEHNITLQMQGVDESDILFEQRICGWINGALLICNSKDHKVEISKSITKGDPYTEIVISL